MDYLKLIARVTSQIPDKGRVKVRYQGRNILMLRRGGEMTSLGPALSCRA